MRTENDHVWGGPFFKPLSILMSLVLLVACTTTKPAVIDSELAYQSGSEQQKEGLRIYIRPLGNKKEIKKYFGADLLAKNILPIFVLIENKSESTFFLFEPAGADKWVENEAGATTGKSGTEGSTYISAEDAKKSVYEKSGKVFGLDLGPPPAFWLVAIPFDMLDADAGPTDASKSLQQALITQALRKQTLTPGKTEKGFIYYQIPEDVSSINTFGINLKATNIETQDEIYFRFTKTMDQEGQNVKN
jgi:hypothetical protein